MLRLGELDYLEMPGLNVMLGSDDYPEGHQGGVSVVQNGRRVATNGDLRLDRTPGQWQPVPRVRGREVDRALGELRLHLEYPDPDKDRRGFNPVEYPDLQLRYTVRVRTDGAAFRLAVDLEAPLPAEWVGRVGLNLELFPAPLFGRTFALDDQVGLFPRQANGPGRPDLDGALRLEPLAAGRRLVVAPEAQPQRLEIELLTPGTLELLDGRERHSNGWFVARSAVPAGATRGAVEWRVAPSALPGFRAAPVVQVSQVGYHPRAPKVAVIELDARDPDRPPAVLARITGSGELEPVMERAPSDWGRFLRGRYLRFDFSAVEAPGMYLVRYGDARSDPFRIAADVYRRHVWQPTLEYFLPVQMCHLRVVDRYRVWHGACHLDDARMAPVDHNHFDGYLQGPSTLSAFAPGERVPGLDRGGWHDAGDHDLRIESQIETVHGLALARETFGVDLDSSTVDQARRVVELGRPDGRPDVLEQLEHGLLSVLGGWRALGRPYRGIIEPTLGQYVLLGDPVNVTDGRPSDDDRWVFTEEHPARALQVAAGLAAAARVLPGYSDALAAECLAAARALWESGAGAGPLDRAPAAVELLLATGDPAFSGWLSAHREPLCAGFAQAGWQLARALPRLHDPALAHAAGEAAMDHAATLARRARETPYGLPYRPRIWGDGWTVLRGGVEAYFLHLRWPELFPAEAVVRALDFVLGCHPGQNPASFVSGVGARSVTCAYGLNRADASFIPGGVVSGTALIRPDLPELLEWPYLWQQTEYVVGSGTTDFLFLALAADRLLNGG